MDWRAAFLSQARSDLRAFQKLATGGFELCHRLHYLQMSSEKLARGWQMKPGSMTPPTKEHAGLVRLLQLLKGSRWVAKKLGMNNLRQFHQYLDGLLDTAGKVQALAPAIAGLSKANPEYPWLDQGRKVIPPCEYEFSELNLDDPRQTKLMKLVRLMTALSEWTQQST